MFFPICGFTKVSKKYTPKPLLRNRSEPKGAKRVPQVYPQVFFEEPEAHKGWRPPKAAATLCVGGRRPPMFVAKGFWYPF